MEFKFYHHSILFDKIKYKIMISLPVLSLNNLNFSMSSAAYKEWLIGRLVKFFFYFF